MEYIKGDATDPIGTGPKIIVHVCNNIGAWGRGFVVAISRKWPGPEASYRQLFAETSGAFIEMGTVQFVPVKQDLWVANMVAQHSIRGPNNPTPIVYSAVGECLEIVAEEAVKLGASVHMPRIGCGLAGGTWDQIEPLINKTLIQREVPVFVYDL